MQRSTTHSTPFVALAACLSWLACVALSASCVQSETTLCASGIRCPDGLVCAPDRASCAAADAVAACVDRTESESCSLTGDPRRGDVHGLCRSGLCVPACGDGEKQEWEECDPKLPVDESCVDKGYDFGKRPGCTVGCAFDESSCGRFGWEEASPRSLLEGTAINALWGSDDRAFAAGGKEGRGVIWRSSPSTWEPMELPSGTGTLYALWGAGPADVFAAGDGGTLLHFDGRAWKALKPEPTRASIRALWGAGPDDLFAACSDGKVLRLRQGSWKVVRRASAGTELRGIWGSGPSDVFAVGIKQESADPIKGVLLHFDADAEPTQDEFEEQFRVELHAVWGSGKDDVFAAGEHNFIYHFDGESWDVMSLPLGSSLRGLWGSGPNNVFAAGVNGALLHFDGAEWSSVAKTSAGNSVDQTLSCIWGSADRVLVGGASGTLLSLETSFLPIRVPGVSWPGGLWGSSARDVFVGGIGEGVAHFDGEVWRMTPNSAALSGSAAFSRVVINAISGTSPQDVYAVGRTDLTGILLHFDGLEWRAREAFDAPLSSVWGADSGEVFTATESDRSALHHFDGSVWNASQMGIGAMRALWGTSARDVYAAGSNAQIVHFDGTGWRTQALPALDTNFNALWGGERHVFAVGSNGGVVRFDGTEWSAQSLTTRELRAAWGHTTDDVLIAGDEGALYHFDGSEWSEIQLPTATPEFFMAAWGPSAKTTYFTARNGLMYRLTRGSAWRRVFGND